jgi:hypothetical protein
VAGSIDAPEMQTYARLSQMPNAMTRGMVQWPGLPAATLKKIAADHYIVHTIIQQRIADVMRYAQPSTHPWKPGWAIELRQGNATPSEQDRKDILDATRFTAQCSSEFGWDARKRDESQITSWPNFLAAITRDTLRYDGIAIWTSMDLQKRVRAFKAVPAGNIMLCTQGGYKGNERIFACGVDEAGSVKHEFTRDELTWVIRNQRTDAEVWGYGYPEIEMTIRLIQSFSDTFNMNSDIFQKDATPAGILKLHGMWPQRQVEVISRIWMNLKRGPTKKWALPAIPVPKDGDITLLDLSRMKESQAYYSDYANMCAGLFCAIYAFPVNRLGYHISGTGKDSEPNNEQTAAVLVDEDDPGLEPLLNTISNAYNSYILWTRFPNLQLSFLGKTPREDSRSFEYRKNASTLNEVRAFSDLPKVETVAASEEHKEIAELMGMAPVDPNLAGIFQNVAAGWLAAKYDAKSAEGTPEGVMQSKKDPAESEKHGHASGVRRDSAAEHKA